MIAEQGLTAIQQKRLLVGMAKGKRRSCGEKRVYHSERDAKMAIPEIERGNIQRGIPVKPLVEYPCTFCGGWHVGRWMSEEELNYAWDKYVERVRVVTENSRATPDMVLTHSKTVL